VARGGARRAHGAGQDHRPGRPEARGGSVAGRRAQAHDARRGGARGHPRGPRPARRQRGGGRGGARGEPLRVVPPHGEVRLVKRSRRLRFQNRVLLAVLLVAAPPWLATLVLLLAVDASAGLRVAVLALVTLLVVIGAFAVQRHVVNPLRSLANMLEALREDDYSLRGRNADPEDALGEVMVEVNTLSRTLHRQRLEAVEAGVLLEKVIAEIDIAVFAFDAARRLRLVNRAGETLLGGRAAELAGRSAAELGLDGLLAER